MTFHFKECNDQHQTSLSNLNLTVIMTLAVFLTLAGCGSSESNVEEGNRTGVLHWGNGTEPQSLDPHIATGVPEHHIIMALMEGLVHKDRDMHQLMVTLILCAPLPLDLPVVYFRCSSRIVRPVKIYQ